MNLRDLPSVDSVLQKCPDQISTYGRSLTTKAVRTVIDSVRDKLRGDPLTPKGHYVAPEGHFVEGVGAEPPSVDAILTMVADLLEEWTTVSPRPVINASGVVLHTNLGRAPLSSAAIHAMQEASHGYAAIEFDLTSGKRGSRTENIEALLQNLTGTEAAYVVNNCASAVYLVLAALLKNKKVIIPRSQLVEIGGGFRVPDVMKQSGAKLLEVGTTNKLRLTDIEGEISALPAGSYAVMRAHQSNFRIIGFTEEPSLQEIIQLTHQYSGIFVDDLGSGALLDTTRYGMAYEPTVFESIQAGADITMFSGDKLLGGPQAGIILGKKALIDRVKKHPLARAVRADKTCLAGLSATLIHYLKDEAEQQIPIWRMISQTPDSIRSRAVRWQQALGQRLGSGVFAGGDVIPGQSTVGGGSLPGETLTTWLLALQVRSINRAMQRLRAHQPPVIARAENQRLLFDPRTVFPEQEESLLSAIQSLFS